MKDRLKDLRTAGHVTTDIELELEPAREAQSEGTSSWPDLFSQVDQLQDSINKLEVTITGIRHLYDDIVNNPVAESSGASSPSSKLESMMAEIKTDSSSVQAKLKHMAREIEEEQRGSGRHSTELRIRKAQHAHLSRKFMTVMEDYNKVQEEYRDKCKERIVRQLKITRRDKTPEEVEQMLDEDNMGVFTQDLVIENERMRLAMGDIEARHNDIVKLEQSMQELLDIFQEMASLVYEQGELIDNIEFNVMSAHEDIREAKGQLKKAVQLKSAVRHKKVACVVVCIIFLGAIALIVGLAVGL